MAPQSFLRGFGWSTCGPWTCGGYAFKPPECPEAHAPGCARRLRATHPLGCGPAARAALCGSRCPAARQRAPLVQLFGVLAAVRHTALEEEFLASATDKFRAWYGRMKEVLPPAGHARVRRRMRAPLRTDVRACPSRLSGSD